MMTEALNSENTVQGNAAGLARAYLLSFILLLLSGIILALTMITDADRYGVERVISRIWVNEMSGALSWLFALPLVQYLAMRILLGTHALYRKAAVLAFGLLACSAIHIASMIMIRHFIFSVMWGQDALDPFAYSGGLLYEFRKDIFAYSMFLLVFSMSRLLAEQAVALTQASRRNMAPGRIMLKSGGTSIWLDTSGFICAEAAGNYVNVSAVGGDYFVRTTLAGLEKDLLGAGASVARVHRSWLVGKDRIESVKPTGDGDYNILLAGGKSLPGSRRFRDSFIA